MRVWDINPGYLNRQSLLGEHSEIHAVVSILTNAKQGYARHPETRRWGKALWALKIRHDLVVSEMALRGYHHRSPVRGSGAQEWPEAFIDTPGRQFTMLRTKYRHRALGHIPRPCEMLQVRRSCYGAPGLPHPCSQYRRTCSGHAGRCRSTIGAVWCRSA